MLHHTGRTSGREYHTPLDAHPVEGGYVFIMMYGPRTDWARNVLATGEAALTIGGSTVRLGTPRLISRDEAWGVISEGTREPPSFLKVADYLRMDTVADGS